LLDPRTDVDVSEFFVWLPAAQKTWYQQRINDDKGPEEQTAAQKAAKHADTPNVLHFDSLGRPFLSILDNGKDDSGNALKFRTRTVLDIEGNQRAVIDALDRVVMRYDYDMLGTRIHQASMEAGKRWMLNEATGRPIRAWNSRKYSFSTEYDPLRRPLRSLVQGGDPGELNARLFPQPIVYERTVYGETRSASPTTPYPRCSSRISRWTRWVLTPMTPCIASSRRKAASALANPPSSLA
jgi:hypothetical protein